MSTPIPATAPVQWRRMHESHPAIEPGLDYYGDRCSRYVITHVVDQTLLNDIGENDDVGTAVWIEKDGDKWNAPFAGWVIGGNSVDSRDIAEHERWIDRPDTATTEKKK